MLMQWVFGAVVQQAQTDLANCKLLDRDAQLEQMAKIKGVEAVIDRLNKMVNDAKLITKGTKQDGTSTPD